MAGSGAELRRLAPQKSLYRVSPICALSQCGCGACAVALDFRPRIKRRAAATLGTEGTLVGQVCDEAGIHKVGARVVDTQHALRRDQGSTLGKGPTLREDTWKVGHLSVTAWSSLRKESEDPGSRVHELDIVGASEREILNSDGTRNAKKRAGRVGLRSAGSQAKKTDKGGASGSRGRRGQE